MIRTIIFTFGFLFGCVFFFYVGLYIHDLNKKLDKLLAARAKESQAFITRTDPGFTNENMVEHSSVIVTPKTPQQVEWEEQAALRQKNPGQVL